MASSHSVDVVQPEDCAGASAFRAVVIGVSSGGMQALRMLLGRLPADFGLPLLVVQHISPDAGDGLALGAPRASS